MASSGVRGTFLRRGAGTSEGTGKRPSYAQGFSSLGLEVRLEDLPVTGQFPAWLTGTLIRNGPGQFEVGNESYKHWFDGLAMLHKFSFRHGRVSYANRFLETGDFLEAAKHGRITGAHSRQTRVERFSGESWPCSPRPPSITPM